MKTPKVSILVPCYNVERYLRQCLDSIVNQTLRDIEIICINDGSTDSTLNIIKKYSANDKRIVIIDKPNDGYGKSMNRGLDVATGEYIGIVESDDWIESDMFDTLYHIAVENDLDVVRCQYYQFKTADNTNTLFDNSWVPMGRVYRPLECQTPFYQAPAIWCNLFRRDMVKKWDIRFLESPGASYQDTAFAFKLYCAATRFMMIPNAYMHYRVDNENSSVNSPGKVFCVNDEYAEIENFARRHNVYSVVRKMIPRIKYACYRWNHARLGRGLKWAFLRRWSDEARADFRNGNIDKSLFSNREYKHLKIIAYFPYLYRFRGAL